MVKGLVLVIIAIGDESSKALSIFHGRHCSIFEIGLNLLGVYRYYDWLVDQLTVILIRWQFPQYSDEYRICGAPNL